MEAQADFSNWPVNRPVTCLSCDTMVTGNKPGTIWFWKCTSILMQLLKHFNFNHLKKAIILCVIDDCALGTLENTDSMIQWKQESS